MSAPSMKALDAVVRALQHEFGPGKYELTAPAVIAALDAAGFEIAIEPKGLAAEQSAALIERARVAAHPNFACVATDRGRSTFQALITKLADTLARHRRWIADLQAGTYVTCVYCGHQYGPGETTPVAMADALKAHVAQCPEHPMSALGDAATAAFHALKSYEFGNTAPDLAAGVAAKLADALANAGLKVP